MFDYSEVPHLRKHGPSGYAQYPYYKPWLRDEFKFRCVYCLEREMWYPNRADSFDVEHINPKSTNPGQGRMYSNMVYACGRCNDFKSLVPLLNPLDEGFGGHIRVDDDGQVVGLTDEGRILVKQLHLTELPAIQNRRDAIELHQLYREYPDHHLVRAKYLRHFGFPEDLPNLEILNPPGGNSIEGSERRSYYQMRMDGTLPEAY